MAGSRTGLSRLKKHVSRSGTGGGRERGRRWLVVAVVFLIGAVVTSLVFFELGRREREQKRAAFQLRAEELYNAVQERFRAPRDLLQLVASFFAASESVTRAEFSTMVRPILERHRSLAIVEWFPLVREEEREAFVAAVRAEGFHRFGLQEKTAAGGLVPAAHRADYLPILYMEPLNPLVLGLDAGSPADGSDEVTRARTTGEATASPPLSLVEDTDDTFSVIYYNPVLRPVAPDAAGGDVVASPTAPSDRGVFAGLVAAVVRVERVVNNATAAAGVEDVQIELVDTTDGRDPMVVYARGYDAEAARGGFEWARRLDFADRTWQLRLAPTVGSDWLPGSHWAVCVAGLLISGLVAFGSGAFLTIGRLREEVDEARELGQYRLLRQLGEGGMGVVYEAEHQMLARPAAIKLIRPRTLAGGTDAAGVRMLLARFEREARATAALSSPHTIRIYDFGRTDAGAFYYVMELLDGLDLWSLVRQGGPVGPGRTVYLLRQVCHSLAEAHETGLIHRDIKPQNVYVCQRGRDYDVAKVLDFGLAKESRHDGEDDPGLTQAGVVVGTPAFMAPEAALSAAEVDARSDLYALGCVAYWLLTGLPVFDRSDSRGFMRAHVGEAPVAPSVASGRDVPADLEEVVLACLEKDPERRPADAESLAGMLAACACAGEWTNGTARVWWETHTESVGTKRVVRRGPPVP